MNASSGSGLCPRRISTAARLPPGLTIVPEEPALELLQELVPLERSHRLVRPSWAETRKSSRGPRSPPRARRRARSPRRVVVRRGSSLERCCGLTARPTPQTAPWPALDPDDDPLLGPVLVNAVKGALGEPRRGRLRRRIEARIQSPRGQAVRDASGTRSRSCSRASSKEERVAAYVIREHERGRPLAEILEDPYVRNRTTPQQRERLLDRPELIRAIGDDVDRVRARLDVS